MRKHGRMRGLADLSGTPFRARSYRPDADAPSRRSSSGAERSAACGVLTACVESTAVRSGELLVVCVDDEDREQARGLGLAGVLAHHVVRAGLFEPALAGVVDAGR